MGYTQVRAFDTGAGGHVPNMCLDNVRRGFGISNKYGSAWEAWQHTQQHPDRSVPTGLAVPLYYSYTATLDGVTQNYGHINVQLPDGRVWSDGNIYASIEAYTANHAPRFVGWGESVNDFKIIQGETMPASQDKVDGTTVALIFNLGLNRDASNQEIADRVNSGITVEELLREIWASPEHVALTQSGVTRDKALAYVQSNLK